MDILYIAIVVVFFLLTFGLMRVCEKLEQNMPEKKS
jgi:hypothetical protein